MESDSALPLQIHAGDMFAGKYRVERVLGRGGMSVVVAAWHPGLGQKVALKLLATPAEIAPEAVTRFFREARAAASLRSEYSARVVDVDVDDMGRHYIVMEHLEGLDLGDLYRQADALPVETCVGYVLHACEAIAEAHALGIIHRDLKPENLFLTHRVDGTPLIKVLDFGVSKLLNPTSVHGGDSGTSTANMVLGTPNYMSPDQIRTPGSIDGRSDVWSLGVILFELLTRRVPFEGDTVPDVLAAVLTSEPPAPSALRAAVPWELSAIVLRCLEKDVDQRWASVGLLAQALRVWAPAWALEAASRAARISGVADSCAPAAASEGAWHGSSRHPASAPREDASARVEAWAARRRVQLSLAALAVSVTGLSAIGLIVARRSSDSPPQQELVAAVETARSSPAPDLNPSAEHQPPLLAALDGASPGMRRRAPDTEAAPIAPQSPRPQASPVPQLTPAPAPAAARLGAPVTHAPERRRKLIPAAIPVDPLSSRR